MIQTMIASLLLWLAFPGPGIARTPQKQEPKIIGYLPDYRLSGDALDNVPRCTDVVFFGSEILGDGTIRLAGKTSEGLGKLKDACKKSQTKLHLCLGGWKKDTHYPTVTAKPALRAKVIGELLELKEAHGFDGVDYDWEYPETPAEMKGFISLCRETKKQLGKDFLVTAAFHPRHKIPRGLVAQLDRIHLMTYDLEAPHCALDHSHAAIKQWTSQGIPPEKFASESPAMPETLAIEPGSKPTGNCLTNTEKQCIRPCPSMASLETTKKAPSRSSSSPKRKSCGSDHLGTRTNSRRRELPSQSLSPKPVVLAMLIITTGGTIDKVYFDAASEFEVGESTVPHIFEDVGAHLEYELISLFRKDSLEITDQDRLEIRRACEESNHSQILITHGTDTMATTADELRDIPGKVIVLTGAMAPSRFRITDAIFNVGTAVGALQSLTEGVYLAMSGRIFEAGTVRKNREAGRFEKL